MPSYVFSNANRFYAALEGSYGQLASITATNRIPALKLTVQQQRELSTRKDKTGSRTFPGIPTGGRLRTTFELRTYLTSWNKTSGSPCYGPLFQAALGAAPITFGGGVISSSTTSGRLAFNGPHLLTPGQAVTYGGEIRFVAALVDANTVQL